MTFYPPKKVASHLIRVGKKFLKNCPPQRVSKEAEFCADNKNVRSLEFSKRKKKIVRKTYFSGT